MKYLIASDIHGSLCAIKKLIEEYISGSYDKLILLGDIYYHGPRNPLPAEYNPMEVANLLNNLQNLVVIKGNCDSEVDQMISSFKFKIKHTEKINGKSIFFTHGHKYNFEKLINDNFDIMFYGHFHIPFIKKAEDGKIFINPGSIALPKDRNKPSFAILTDTEIIIKDFDGNMLFETIY